MVIYSDNKQTNMKVDITTLWLLSVEVQYDHDMVAGIREKHEKDDFYKAWDSCPMVTRGKMKTIDDERVKGLKWTDKN